MRRAARGNPVCIVTVWGASVYGWIGDWTAVGEQLRHEARHFWIAVVICVVAALAGWYMQAR